jgi:hypothetical protein
LRRHIKDFDADQTGPPRLFSPADLESHELSTSSAVTPMAALCSIDQFFIWRPFAHSTNGVGLVRGLIHIGASTHPGPGLGGGSGFNWRRKGWGHDGPIPARKTPRQPAPLGEVGLTNFAPYLMNRIMGRYNASLRDEMAELGLTTPKMRALAVFSVVEGPLIGNWRSIL